MNQLFECTWSVQIVAIGNGLNPSVVQQPSPGRFVRMLYVGSMQFLPRNQWPALLVALHGEQLVRLFFAVLQVGDVVVPKDARLLRCLLGGLVSVDIGSLVSFRFFF